MTAETDSVTDEIVCGHIHVMSRTILSVLVPCAVAGAPLFLCFACGTSDIAVVQSSDAAMDVSSVEGPLDGAPDERSDAPDSALDGDLLPDTAFDACINFPGVPDATIYECEAGAPGTVGCVGTDPVTSDIYPLGCDIIRPVQAGSHCGGLACSCTDQFGAGPADAGGTWICPD